MSFFLFWKGGGRIYVFFIRKTNRKCISVRVYDVIFFVFEFYTDPTNVKRQVTIIIKILFGVNTENKWHIHKKNKKLILFKLSTYAFRYF